MNRRAFFRALGLGAASIAAAPYLPALIQAFPAPPMVIPCRKIMARIRITEEAMLEPSYRAFVKAGRLEMARFSRDIAYREDRSWV